MVEYIIYTLYNVVYTHLYIMNKRSRLTYKILLLYFVAGIALCRLCKLSVYSRRLASHCGCGCVCRRRRVQKGMKKGYMDFIGTHITHCTARFSSARVKYTYIFTIYLFIFYPMEHICLKTSIVSANKYMCLMLSYTYKTHTRTHAHIYLFHGNIMLCLQNWNCM